MKKEIIYLLLFVSVVGLTFWWFIKMDQIKNKNTNNIGMENSIVGQQGKKNQNKDRNSISKDSLSIPIDQQENEINGNIANKEIWVETLSGTEKKSNKVEDEYTSPFPKAGELVKPELQSGNNGNSNDQETWKENLIEYKEISEATKEVSSPFPKAGEVVKPELQSGNIEDKDEVEEIEENWETEIDEEITPLEEENNDNLDNREENIDKNENTTWTNEKINYDTSEDDGLLGTEL